jgi:hypothetical protein
VLEKALAGPLNLLVKFSTLQEYGVDKPFFLENDNVDSSQRNIVFLVRGEKASLLPFLPLCITTGIGSERRLGRQNLLCLVSLDP